MDLELLSRKPGLVPSDEMWSVSVETRSPQLPLRLREVVASGCLAQLLGFPPYGLQTPSGFAWLLNEGSHTEVTTDLTNTSITEEAAAASPASCCGDVL